MIKFIVSDYIEKLNTALTSSVMSQVVVLAESLRIAWEEGNTVFFCGNGGSVGNAIHLANDYR